MGGACDKTMNKRLIEMYQILWMALFQNYLSQSQYRIQHISKFHSNDALYECVEAHIKMDGIQESFHVLT